jgi:hypothetical protein
LSFRAALFGILWTALWGAAATAVAQIRLDSEVEVGIGHDSNPLLTLDTPAGPNRVSDAFALFSGYGRIGWTHRQWKSELEYQGAWSVYRNRSNGTDATNTGTLTVGRTMGRMWTLQGIGKYERFSRSALAVDRYRLWVAGLSASFDGGNGMRVTTSGMMEWRAYPEFLVPSSGEGLRDRQWLGRLTIEQPFTPRLGGALTLSGRKARTSARAFDYWTVILGGQAWYTITPAFMVSAGYMLDRRRGDAEHQTFRAGRWQWGTIEGTYMGIRGWGCAVTYAWYRYSGQDSGDRLSGNQIAVTAFWAFGRGTVAAPTSTPAVARRPQYTPSPTSRGWRFTVYAPDARSVALVGTFNGWDRKRHLLKGPDEAGQWSITLPLPSGTHQYAFVIDDEVWIKPPDAPAYLEDGFGNWNGIINVSGDRTQP